jgi:hypothetical protein
MSPGNVRVAVLGMLLGLSGSACGTSSAPADGGAPTPSASPGGAPAASASYPLRVDGAGRRLVDAQGRPFFVVGDAAWSLIVRLTREEATRYLTDRRARGFNTVLVNLVEHHFGGPPDRAGDDPFRVPGDFSTTNDAYFDHAEWVVDEANRQGILVLLAPLYLGYEGGVEGWYQEVLRNGAGRCREYGRYVGRRFARHPNVVWIDGGDTWPRSAGEHVDALVAGIKEGDPAHLHTAHNGPERSAIEDYDRPWLDVNTTYVHCERVVRVSRLDQTGRARTLPFFHVEGKYENEGADASCLLAQAYYPALMGARGHVFGNRPMWLFDPGWEGALGSAGAGYMAHYAALMQSRDGASLVPDTRQSIVVGGAGDPEGNDYVAAARSPSGSVLAYVPTSGRRITVDASSVSGASLVAWWFDPFSGRATRIGSFATGGRLDFTSPGGSPWVLVLDDAQRNLPAPGVAAAP